MMNKQEIKQTEVLANMPVVECRQQMRLEIGKKYTGSFWINEYGQISVSPYQKGKNPQGLKRVCEGDNYVIYTSKNLVRMVLTFPRLAITELSPLVRCALENAYKKIFTYNLQKEK